MVTEESSSFSFSSGDPSLPCIYSGVPYMHGESWKLDVCTLCSCDNATVTCVIESCQAAFCVEPIKPDGECCYYCPFSELIKSFRCYSCFKTVRDHVKVKFVKPKITSEGTIAEGRENQISLDVPIKFQELRETTGVSGENLWTLSAWTSPNQDGRGQR
nr:cysteine-rich motor neuron 1 protein-like [Lytechinus pictus]